MENNNKNVKNGKTGKKGIKIICIILAAVILLGAGSYGLLIHKFKELHNATPDVTEDNMTYDFDADETVVTLEDNPEFDKIFEKTADTFKGSIKAWATNGGDIMYSKDVLNILCIGVDTRNKNTISGLTDSMVLVSINKNIGRIVITSVMRDCYAYLLSPGGEESYNKINSAFPFYGIENLISTFESHFKIKIDGYAMINFNFFKAAIDKVGGVNVKVQQYEADYLKSAYKLDVDVGKSVTLNGEQALAFCRSRKCDSDGDISRTRRQRAVVISLIRKAASINPAEFPDYIAYFLPFLKTNYTEEELVSLATKAVLGGWGSYPLYQDCFPSEKARYGYNGSTWFWAVDYPLAAQALQNKIYDETNIVLQENRVTAIELLLGKGE